MIQSVSKNKCIDTDKPVRSLDEIANLANANRAVYHINMGMKPAKVFIMMQMNIIINGINNKQFFRIWDK